MQAVIIVMIALVILTICVVSTLGNQLMMMVKGIHENAAALALSICHDNECIDQIGWGSKQLSTDTSEQILQRWCIEVLYVMKETIEVGTAAVEIILVDRDNDNPDNWKIVNTVYGANCSAMK